jgi:hypothetical protein
VSDAGFSIFMDVDKVGTPSELNATHGLEEGIRIKRFR